jgi:hypothetical protein
MVMVRVWPIISGILVLFSAICGQLVAQDNKDRHFSFMPGYAYQQGRDNGMSPLTYSGSNLAGQLALHKTKAGGYHNLALSFALGQMRPGKQTGAQRSQAVSLLLQFNYSRQFQLMAWKDDRLRLFLGGSWLNLLNLRWHQSYVNNALNYEFSSAIGPASMLVYDLTIAEKPFRVYGRLDIPFLAFNLRPAYASSIPDGFIARERSAVRAFFDSGKMQSFNNFFRFRNELGIQKKLNNQNMIAISYCWDFYHINQYHAVNIGVHQIMGGWFFHF